MAKIPEKKPENTNPKKPAATKASATPKAKSKPGANINPG